LFDEEQIDPKKPLALARYNQTKRGGQRRVFSTPNPLFFVDSSSYFVEHRAALARLMRKSSISRSVPQFEPSFGRAVRIDSFGEFTAFRRSELSSSRYIVKTDVSRFFPSIYTHSIPWAVHGKAQAKQDRSRKSAQTHANKLDYLVRQSQDQQTVGIPVGPDTSRIICELIAGAIDAEFRTQVGPDVVGARLVDDVYIGASSYEEAEKYLSAYRDAIRQFELDINENKTRIFEAKRDLEPFWPVSIRREIEGFAGSPASRANRSDLSAYLDEIIRSANADNDEGIIKYAIRKMDDRKLWGAYWEVLEPFLIRAAISFPHCLDYIARVVVWRHRRFSINTTKWRKVCQSTIAYHAPMGHDSEVSWACWILKEIGGRLPTRLCDPIINRCGPFSVLLAMDLDECGVIAGKFPKNLVYSRLGANSMLSNDWLLSYEAERSFGYRLKTKNRNDYSVFGDLIEGNAAFYDQNATLFVFQGVDDIDDVDEALEHRIGLYDDEDFPGDEDGDDVALDWAI
jgi:hypothetical protein